MALVGVVVYQVIIHLPSYQATDHPTSEADIQVVSPSDHPTDPQVYHTDHQPSLSAQDLTEASLSQSTVDLASDHPTEAYPLDHLTEVYPSDHPTEDYP